MKSNMILKGNVYRSHPSAGTPLYLGSGDFGGCFDSTGLMGQPYSHREHANTVFMHADYWHRGNYGLDYHLPAFQLCFSEIPQGMKEVQQQLDVWDGMLTTCWQSAVGSCRVSNVFHPYQRDLFVTEIEFHEITNQFPEVAVKVVEKVQVDYGTNLQGTLTLLSQEEERQKIKLSAGNAELILQIRLEILEGSADLRWEKDHPQVHFLSQDGKIRLYIAASSPQRQTLAENQLTRFCREDFFASAKEGWHKRWGTSDFFFEAEKVDALFVRSVYYMLCSFSPESNCIAPPTGWTSNGWAYHFPQDFSYILPVLLKLGHFDIAKAKMEFYHRQLGVMEEYTKRIYGADGVMWAWEFPIGDGSHILPDESPNWYQFEIHNAAYPARMAYETAKCLHDDEWTRKIAWEMVEASARFYTSILHKEGPTWGIHLIPSMGQDEWGGENAKNYLCSLYAAKFTLKTAVKMAKELGIEPDKRWEEILKDGLAFDRLVNRRLGIYQTCEGPESEYQIGLMKHPIPLMPITFLPLEEELMPYEENAWNLRYQLCERSGQNYFSGWTLVDLMLADVRMKDPESFWQDFERMIPSDYIDPEYIAIHESSHLRGTTYYITSHGLFAQAVLDGAVHDYFGKPQTDSLNLNCLSFDKIYLRSGASCSNDKNQFEY